MKIRVGDLKKIIKEEASHLNVSPNGEFLPGVPLWALREATRKYVDEVRQHVKRHVLLNRSGKGLERRDAEKAAEEALADLEGEMNALLEDKLWSFLRST